MATNKTAKKATRKTAAKKAATARKTTAKASVIGEVRKYRPKGGFPTNPDLSHVEVRGDGASRLVPVDGPERPWLEGAQRPYSQGDVDGMVRAGFWEEVK
jgi:hypothetical protein